MRRSRWYHAAPGTEAEAHNDLAAYLDRLPWPRAVLMPCSDNWTLAVSRLPAELRHRFPASLPAGGVLDALVDKLGLAALLATLDLPHPDTRAVESERTLAEVPDEQLQRSFLKPRDSQRFFARYGAKACRFTGRIQAGQVLQRLTAAKHRMVLQEYVAGPASNHYFVDGFATAGVAETIFVRRRLRMHPRDFGNSTYMVSITPDEAAPAVRTVRQLLSHVKYRGPFSAEFKRDERDGEFKLLELNVRPWWYVEFASQCGVNVCAMAYRDALGLPVTPVRSYAVGRTCVYPAYDLDACRELRQRGELSLAEWARSWLLASKPVFRLSDPIPGIAGAAGFAVNRLRRLVAAPLAMRPSWELDPARLT